jgi:uncharacterized protein YdhG (YjbR/CyaY superfamily)
MLFMWKCPKCGKELKNVNQSHYCVKVNTIDEYIACQDAEIQPILQKIYETIRTAAPDAKEKISYQMPTFWQGENLVHFAAHKNHIGFYPGGEATNAFAKQLESYKTSKGTIQLPLNKPFDYGLIADITKWRVKCVMQND